MVNTTERKIIKHETIQNTNKGHKPNIPTKLKGQNFPNSSLVDIVVNYMIGDNVQLMVKSVHLVVNQIILLLYA